MKNLMDENEKSEIYKCRNYLTKIECKTCDGFGRNTNEKINIRECYVSNAEIQDE